MMAGGFCGRILDVDLSAAEVAVVEKDERFFRAYGGGPGIGLYYLLNDVPAGTDPLGPGNVLVFAAGLLTGTAAPSVPRYTVCALSPLTGALGKAEAGGWWGPELKMAGFDAVVVRGRAAKPVYLWIHDGTAEIRDAGRVWGMDTGDSAAALKGELGDERARIALIGPGGEQLVRFANIVNELVHFNGRNGLGAVMGSKNLKAIAVRGTTRVAAADQEAVQALARWVAEAAKENALAKLLHIQGTAATVTANDAAGGLPTRNWSAGSFEAAKEIGGDRLTDEYLSGTGTCFACPVRCKRAIKGGGRLAVDAKFGGPEYETIAALGSNCGVGDMDVVCKANELCNRLGMDTISTGSAIAFAMQCTAAGIIGAAETDGRELRFGDGQAVLEMIGRIARREGFGDLLAEGVRLAAKRLGKRAERYTVEVKGQDAPMHDPRVKAGVGLQYALSPIGADHWFAQHDPFFAPGNPVGAATGQPLGILEGTATGDLTGEKVRVVYYTSMLNLMYDALGACFFGFAPRSVTPLAKMIALVQAVTGWDTNLLEMMKVGERISNMAREFNCRQGFGTDDDVLPAKFFEPLPSGPNKGKATIDPVAFQQAVDCFYEMAGWPGGRPSKGKLYELGLGWLAQK
jgi:aldehyde:ferredoxin oxidoreductase